MIGPSAHGRAGWVGATPFPIAARLGVEHPLSEQQAR